MRSGARRTPRAPACFRSRGDPPRHGPCAMLSSSRQFGRPGHALRIRERSGPRRRFPGREKISPQISNLGSRIGLPKGVRKTSPDGPRMCPFQRDFCGFLSPENSSPLQSSSYQKDRFFLVHVDDSGVCLGRTAYRRTRERRLPILGSPIFPARLALLSFFSRGRRHERKTVVGCSRSTLRRARSVRFHLRNP